ncbi:hypothetical protein MPTK1_8g05220 [Marchantia polymorpha subsp. ruderalis]|uniref:Uncharacterized protein n=1 Tax=Marchantia polymorpha TaxID=3197 RepID=A0A2R6WKB1_MARPO|nr:hypothetical protein MARPO_0081s0023 [Marchantia polymorpha]BBN18757.1 hypothetical protein Mp_8g05220 [Marchantia polymorpha subsp. ruderalis]|eukprot:PTQ34296.1 hypothetical protein MARPO_0081s0023 [Marchantia polymorpha]
MEKYSEVATNLPKSGDEKQAAPINFSQTQKQLWCCKAAPATSEYFAAPTLFLCFIKKLKMESFRMQ